MVESPRPGAGMTVTRERLIPLWVTGTFFGVALVTFAAIPFFLWTFRAELAAHVVRHPGLVFVVHLYALGWGTAVALGAIQQLGPVLFKSDVMPNPTQAAIGLAAYIAGLCFLLGGMFAYHPEAMVVGGSLLLIAIGTTMANMLRTLRGQGRRSVVLRFAVPAFLSLISVALVGVVLAWNMQSGLLGLTWAPVFFAHLYLGPLGWFGLLIPGVSYELGPFFGLTRQGRIAPPVRFVHAVAWLLLIGIVGGLIATAARIGHPILLVPAAVGYALFLFDLRWIYTPRERVRRTAVLTGVRLSHLYLALLTLALFLAAVGVDLFGDWRIVAAFGWLTAAGWVSNAVAAYLHRILPFLLWHHRYWGKGKDEIKTPFQHMISQKAGRLGFYIYNTGVLLVAAGFALPATLGLGIAILAAGTLLLVGNLAASYWR